MAFVRPKVVEGRTYYQLVHNHRAAGKHRQKVLCHLGKHSALELAIEDMSREEEELRNKTAEVFRKTTEIKQNILDRYSEIIDREIPSLGEACSMEDEAWEYFDEYYSMEDEAWEYAIEYQDLVGYQDYCVEREKRRHMYLRAVSLTNIVRRYHRTMRKAEWYDDRANKAQEKKSKLMDFKKKYPNL